MSLRIPTSTRSKLLWSGFWLLMLAGHARAVGLAWAGVASSGPVGPDLLRPVILTLASLFFLLKLLDVSWMRFRTDRRGIAALALIVALLHLQTVGLATDNQLLPQILATASAVLFLEPVQRRWDQAFERMSVIAQADSVDRDRHRPSRLLESLTDLVERTPQWRIIHTATPPRAPPA